MAKAVLSLPKCGNSFVTALGPDVDNIIYEFNQNNFFCDFIHKF